MDASGKGYGGHLGPADQPIALFQQKRLSSLPSPVGQKRLDIQTDLVYVREAAALYLSRHHFRPLLRGATVVAHTDNSSVFEAFRNEGSRAAHRAIWTIVDAVRILVGADDISLEVKLVKGKKNRLADALSRFARSDSAKYPEIIMSMREDRLEGSNTARELIKKIAAASLIYKNAQDEEISNTAVQDKPDQEPPPMETVTGDTSTWELVEKEISPTEMTVHVLPVSAQSDVSGTSHTDRSEQAELPTETAPDDFDPLFRAMDNLLAAKDKKAKVRVRAIKTAKVKAVKPVVAKDGKVEEAKAEAVMTPCKEEEAIPMATSTKETKTTKTIPDTSGPALIEAAENLIKQAQELVKAAKKLVKAAGKKK